MKISSLKEIKAKGIPQIKWRVDKLIPERGITVFGGSSGSYKTWMAMALSLSVSAGKPFLFQFDTKSCNVLYLDEENGDITLPVRFNKLIEGNPLLNHDFNNLQLSIFNGIKLDYVQWKGKGQAVAQETISKIIKQYSIRLVIVDSMVRCMAGEENKAEDVRLVFENLKNIFKEYQDLSFVILHHTTKNGKGMNALRGSGDFGAFADVILMFESTRGKVNIEVVKNRHIDLNKFNRFSVNIENPDEGGISFGYQNYDDANSTIIQRCEDWMVDHFNSNKMVAFETKNILSLAKNNGFPKNCFFSTIKKMLNEGIISKLTRGRYQIKNPDFIDEEEVEDC